MDFATLIGLGSAFVFMLSAFIMEGGDPLGLLQVTAAMIVFGGTLGAVLVSFPLSQVMHALYMARGIFTDRVPDETAMLEQINKFADKARREGVLSLESEVKAVENPIMRSGLRLVVDGIEPQHIKEILNYRISHVEHGYHQAAAIFEAAGGYSPTMGIIGTVLGLISVLSNLSDPDELGHKIALAFIATLFGVAFANLVWLPFGNKLKVKSRRDRLFNDRIAVGLLGIQAGENPRLIQDKIASQH